MKKLATIFVLILKLHINAFAQCPTEIKIYKNSDVDSLIQLYPQCKNINKVGIYDKTSNINKLDDWLDNIGGLTISNTNLLELNFEKAIILHSFIISKNDSIKSINIKGIGDAMRYDVGLIELNTALSSIQLNFNQLHVLHIENNTNNFITFNNLNENFIIKNQLNLYGKIKVTNKKIRVENSIQIRNNQVNTQDRIPLSKIMDQRLSGGLTINNSNLLEEIKQTDSIKFISSVIISNVDWPDLSFFKKSNLKMDALSFSECPNIKNLDGMQFCTTSGLAMQSMSRVEQINDIKFDSVFHNFWMIDCASLQDISNVNQIKRMKLNSSFEFFEFKIIDNPKLEYCNYKTVCNLLSSPPPFLNIEINNNLNACSDKQEVINACITKTGDAVFNQTDLETYELSIYNLDGRLLYNLPPFQHESRKSLSKGLYIFQYKDDNKQLIVKKVFIPEAIF